MADRLFCSYTKKISRRYGTSFRTLHQRGFLNMLLPVVIILILWLPLYGCTKPEPSSETSPEGNAANAGSDPSSGAAVTAPAPAEPPAAEIPAKEPEEWKTFRGEYFDVQYPGSFAVESSGEADGISFTAPDRSVRFYVFSPLWNGESKQYDADPDDEIVRQHSVEREGSRKITRITYQYREDPYIRSFEDVEDTLYNTRRIFGVFYTSQKAYSDHKDLYLRFKRSLKQYADH